MEALPDKAAQVALIDVDKGNIMDITNKKFVRSIPDWGGTFTPCGRYGLYAPSKGGLDLVDLRKGIVKMQLLPKVSEGIFNVICKFNASNEYVMYYHAGRNTLRLFRMSDWVMIANYRLPSEITSMESTTDGKSIALGSVDGMLTVLTIADPNKKYMIEYLRELPSRQIKTSDEEEEK